MKKFKVLIIGGSGYWSNKNHCRAILDLKSQNFQISVLAICDPINPQSKKDRIQLQEILQVDNPVWLFDNDTNTLLEKLSAFHTQHHIDVAIIVCNPVFHYLYCNWAGDNHINVICDKPLN